MSERAREGERAQASQSAGRRERAKAQAGEREPECRRERELR